eukprot:scaffold7328_cov314-Pinguiococcus_pyrenoidosus.AAC.79
MAMIDGVSNGGCQAPKRRRRFEENAPPHSPADVRQLQAQCAAKLQHAIGISLLSTLARGAAAAVPALWAQGSQAEELAAGSSARVWTTQHLLALRN